MKFQPWTSIVVLAASLAGGCDKHDTTPREIDKLQAKSEKAVQEIKDYTYAEKPVLVAKLQNEIASLNHDLSDLSAKVEKSSDAAKAEAAPKLQALRAQMGKLNEQLEAAKSASEPAWESVKAGSQKAFEEVKRGLSQARQWVSEKVSP